LELKVGMTVHAHSWFTNTDVVDYFISNPVLAGGLPGRLPTP
jgi:Xaa-Pro dipeptidase